MNKNSKIIIKIFIRYFLYSNRKSPNHDGAHLVHALAGMIEKIPSSQFHCEPPNGIRFFLVFYFILFLPNEIKNKFSVIISNFVHINILRIRMKHKRIII